MLREFWEIHPDAEQALRAWYTKTKQADWESTSDVKKDYRNASFVANNRVIFNIKGKQYRLVVAINYPYQIVYIRFVGTHNEYDKIDTTTIWGNFMDIKPIKTESDYNAALVEIERLMKADLNTPEGDKLDVLTTLVEAYEEKYYPIGPPDPIEAIIHQRASSSMSPVTGFLAYLVCPFITPYFSPIRICL